MSPELTNIKTKLHSIKLEFDKVIKLKTSRNLKQNEKMIIYLKLDDRSKI